MFDKRILGIVGAVIILGLDLIFFRAEKIFYFIIGMGFIVGALPFVVSIMLESKKEKENNEMFLEFSRNLVESIKAGTPISKAIINLKDKYYGSLTPYIQKLANQISLGIPVKEALEIFARDVDSRVVGRAVTLIGEAQQAGGEIESILESVAKSVSETEKLKKERQSSVYGMIVQGYIIFFIFTIIMLVMQFKILPMTSDIGNVGAGFSGLGGGTASSASAAEVSRPMLYLLFVQGLFTGLVVGKIAEGSIKAGIKHSFLMVTMSLLIYTGGKAFF